jgi:ABC-2 type transport system ATP-binding protein
VVARRGRTAVRARGRGVAPLLNALAARGLTKRYGAALAVDALDLTVDEGTLFGFLGPNGAGKTTTIRMMLGLVFPTAGEVEVLGRSLLGGEATTAEALRGVGALIEEPAAWRWLSGRRNLQYFARCAGPAADRRARLGRVDEVLRLVGLDDAGSKKVKAYSQGMRQRLGIAMAMLGAPRVLVLDEPTNGLDPSGMRDIRLLLRRLADEGTTVFVSSHLLWEVEAMCDRVGVLARGRLVAEGPPSSLRAAADRLAIRVDDARRARRILELLDGVTLEEGSPPALAAAADGDGSFRVRLAAPATAAAVNAALVAGDVAVSALIPEQASLEDTFLSLVEPNGPAPGPMPNAAPPRAEEAGDVHG